MADDSSVEVESGRSVLVRRRTYQDDRAREHKRIELVVPLEWCRMTSLQAAELGIRLLTASVWADEQG